METRAVNQLKSRSTKVWSWSCLLDCIEMCDGEFAFKRGKQGWKEACDLQPASSPSKSEVEGKYTAQH